MAMNCYHCKRMGLPETFRTFPVHYGRKVGEQTTSVVREPNVIRSTKETTYEVCGHTSVDLCSACIRRCRLKWKLIGAVLMVGGFVLMGTLGYAVPALAIMGLPMMILGIIAFAWSLGRGFGQRWAVSLVHGDYKKRYGYDSFWSDKEFAALQRQH